MAARTRFSKSEAIISSLAIASVIITVIIVVVVAMSQSQDNRGIKLEAYVQEPYVFPSGAAEKCVELWFRPPPDHPGEEVIALCDALLLKIFDYIKGTTDFIPSLMESAANEQARDAMEEARIFQTLLVMTDWSSK